MASNKNPIRSDSRKSARFNALLGTSSQEFVRSEFVDPLLLPPAASSHSSNLPSGTFPEPSNMMCSKRWAKPVRPGLSRPEPTWYHIFTLTIGVEWSSCRMTLSPLSRIWREYSIWMFLSWAVTKPVRPKSNSAINPFRFMACSPF